MELVAEEDAPKLDYLDLLQGHPSDISQADKAAAAEARQQAAAAAESARSEVSNSSVLSLVLGGIWLGLHPPQTVMLQAVPPAGLVGVRLACRASA